MDTSLIINATNSGKKLQKAITNINPDKSNSVLKEFAQKVNALTTNNYVDATRVNKMSVEETAPSGALLDPNLREGNNSYVTWDGNGVCYFANDCSTEDEPITIQKDTQSSRRGFYMLESDGTYTKDWLYVHWDGPT